MNFDDLNLDTPEGDEIDTSIEFRPTLVIGLGGTGHEVLVRLKARFIETFGKDIFRIVKLLCFDTAEETVTIDTALGQPVNLTKETELINIGHVPVSSLIANLDIHPTLKAWLPEKMDISPNQSLFLFNRKKPPALSYSWNETVNTMIPQNLVVHSHPPMVRPDSLWT